MKNNSSDNVRIHPSLYDNVEWGVTLVDSCNYGLIGLDYAVRCSPFLKTNSKIVLSVSSLHEVQLAVSPEMISSKLAWCLVVRLPLFPLDALILLLQLGDLIETSTIRCQKIVMLSHFDVDVVKMLTRYIVGKNILVLDVRLPISSLWEKGMSTYGADVNINGKETLSMLERGALLQSLQFKPTYFQARNRNVSVKTVYSHRVNGLTKLGCNGFHSLFNLLMSSNIR